MVGKYRIGAWPLWAGRYRCITGGPVLPFGTTMYTSDVSVDKTRTTVSAAPLYGAPPTLLHCATELYPLNKAFTLSSSNTAK